MKNLTTPQAILCGFALISLAIASIPYSSNIVTPTHAAGIQKVAICNKDGYGCANVVKKSSTTLNGLLNWTIADDTKLKK